MHSTTNTSTKHILCSFEEILLIFDRKQKPFQHLHTFCNIFPSCSVHAPVPFIICLYIIIATWTSFESTKQNPNIRHEPNKPPNQPNEWPNSVERSRRTSLRTWMNEWYTLEGSSISHTQRAHLSKLSFRSFRVHLCVSQIFYFSFATTKGN